jgi:hypothetical protein
VSFNLGEDYEVVVEEPLLTVDVEDPLATDVLVIPVAGAPGSMGPSGPAGEQGPQGPPGADGTGYYAEFSFAIPSTTWTIEHNQGSYALVVETYDNANTLMIGSVSYPDVDHIVIEWYYPTTGTARVFS